LTEGKITTNLSRREGEEMKMRESECKTGWTNTVAFGQIIRNWIISGTFVLLLPLIMQGCVFDDDKPANPDRGTYTLAFSDSTMSTYPGGGCVIIMEMTPSEDFEGSVRLEVKGETGLNARVNKSDVTSEKRITEIIIHPDSTLAPGKYQLSLYYTHGGKIGILPIPVINNNYGKPLTYDFACDTVLPEFMNWCQENYPKLKTLENNDYLVYAISGTPIGGSAIYIAVNSEWEMHFHWTIHLGDPPLRGTIYSKFLIRRMGEKEPTYYLMKNIEGNAFVEKRPSEFVGYSHLWKESAP
jgi:hypothetical protein